MTKVLVQDDLYMEREPDAVRLILCAPRNPDIELWSTKIPLNIFASAICNLTDKGEDHYRWFVMMAFLTSTTVDQSIALGLEYTRCDLCGRPPSVLR